jgi:hypothetical protein
VLKIVDKEIASYGSGSFKFAEDDYTVGEDDGVAIITVDRITGASGETSVSYQTSNGTATSGSDYTGASGTLTFKEGETRKHFEVEIKDDEISDAGETVNLALTNPTAGSSLATPSIATLTIE